MGKGLTVLRAHKVKFADLQIAFDTTVMSVELLFLPKCESYIL